MSIEDTDTIILPSSPADIQKLKNAATEISNSLTRIEAERDQINSIIDKVHEEISVDKKHVRKLGKTYHKQNFDKVVNEEENFQSLYEQVFGPSEE